MKATDYIRIEQLKERSLTLVKDETSSSQTNSEKQKRYQARRTFAEMILAKIATIWRFEDERLSDERVYEVQLQSFIDVLDGLTPTQVTVGLHRISFCKYAPTPATFRELCLPSLEEAGLVEVETVYQQLCRRVTDKKFTLSPPVAWIYKNIDTSMLMDSKRQDEARRIVAQWYSRAADKICKGDDFTEDDPLPIEIKVKPVAPPMTENEMFETWKQMGWTGIMRSYQQKRGTNAAKQGEHPSKGSAD